MTLAFGKAILAGEHAVVYGHPAVAVALDRGIKCVAERTSAEASSLFVADWGLQASSADETPLGRGIATIQKEITDGVGLSYRVTAEIPPGAGLGSSAALSVALIRAASVTMSKALGTVEIVDWANRLEEEFHDRPSGIDVALSSRGGALLFQPGHTNENLDASWLKLVVADTGEPRSTKDMIAKVSAQLPVAERALVQMGAAARDVGKALARKEHDLLADSMNSCQQLLDGLGLVTPGLDKLCTLAKKSGAMAAKMTGGGGGGAIIAFAPGREDEVCNVLDKEAKSAFVCAVARPV